MVANKFRDRLIQLGIATGARVVLPEINDSRIVDAKRELLQLGFNILELADSSMALSDLKESIAKLKFTKNWTDEQLHAFIENPLNVGAPRFGAFFIFFN